MAIDLWERPLPEGPQRDLELLISHVDALGPILRGYLGSIPDVSPSPAYAKIARELAIDRSEIVRIFSALENIVDVRDGLKDAQGVRGLLEKSISKTRADRLSEKSAAFDDLLSIYTSDHPIHITIKAEKLSFLHENLYQDGEIITDVRPVFDGSGEAVKEMVIAHTLVLASWSSTGGKRTHFAMDAKDVLRLRDGCERAIRKANALKVALGKSAWAVKVLNDDDDAG